MPTTQSTAACFIRPIRPDVLQRAGSKLRTLQVSAGVARADAAPIAKGLVAVARLCRKYLDGIRSLQRARGAAAAAKVLDGIRVTLESLRDQIETLGPTLRRAVLADGDGGNGEDVWFEGGSPKELTSEAKLQQQLTALLGALVPVRVSDIAHLACLWSDAQRFHAALRTALRAGPKGTAGLLASAASVLEDHVLPVDLKGLPGDPGLLDGVPAMVGRLGRLRRTR